jgi:hypothetical protein
MILGFAAMRRIPLLAFSCLLGGCASLSSFQEARVLEKGKWAVSLPVELDEFEPHGSLDSDGGRLLSPQFGIRHGLGDGLDIGVRATALVFTGVSVDAKRQWIGRDSLSPFQVSSGIKLACAIEPDLKVGSDKLEKYNALDLALPLYLGWTPARMLGVTLNPQACYRFSTDDSKYPSGPIAGANADLRLGHRVGVVLEAGYHHQFFDGYDMINCGLSLFGTF